MFNVKIAKQLKAQVLANPEAVNLDYCVARNQDVLLLPQPPTSLKVVGNLAYHLMVVCRKKGIAESWLGTVDGLGCLRFFRQSLIDLLGVDFSVARQLMMPELWPSSLGVEVRTATSFVAKAEVIAELLDYLIAANGQYLCSYMVNLKRLNRPVLGRLQDDLRANPDEFTMGLWVYLTPRSCRTVGCIAYKTMVVAGFEQEARTHIHDTFNDQATYFPARAAAILGIDQDIADQLFHADNWPEPFRTDYEEAQLDDSSDRASRCAELACGVLDLLAKQGHLDRVEEGNTQCLSIPSNAPALSKNFAS